MKKGILVVIVILMLLSITACADIRKKTKLEKFMEELENSGFDCDKESLTCIYEKSDVIDKPDVYSSQYLSYAFYLDDHIFSSRARIFGTNNINGNIYEDDRTSIYNYEENRRYSIVNNYKYDCQTNIISFFPSIGSQQLTYNCDNIGIYDIYYYSVTSNCSTTKQQCNVASNNMSLFMDGYTIDDLLEED